MKLHEQGQLKALTQIKGCFPGQNWNGCFAANTIIDFSEYFFRFFGVFFYPINFGVLLD